MIMKLFRDARGLARKYAQPGPAGRLHHVLDEIDSIGMTAAARGMPAARAWSWAG